MEREFSGSDCEEWAREQRFQSKRGRDEKRGKRADAQDPGQNSVLCSKNNQKADVAEGKYYSTSTWKTIMMPPPLFKSVLLGIPSWPQMQDPPDLSSEELHVCTSIPNPMVCLVPIYHQHPIASP